MFHPTADAGGGGRDAPPTHPGVLGTMAIASRWRWWLCRVGGGAHPGGEAGRAEHMSPSRVQITARVAVVRGILGLVRWLLGASRVGVSQQRRTHTRNSPVRQHTYRLNRGR